MDQTLRYRRCQVFKWSVQVHLDSQDFCKIWQGNASGDLVKKEVSAPYQHFYKVRVRDLNTVITTQTSALSNVRYGLTFFQTNRINGRSMSYLKMLILVPYIVNLNQFCGKRSLS